MKASPVLGKKRSILDAARRLLERRGFQDVALDDVARQAGVAKGTIFLYYRSKDELFEAAFADLVDRLGEVLESLLKSGKSGRSLLEATILAILEHFDEHRDFVSQFGAGRFPGCGGRSCDRLMTRFAKNMRLMVDILRRCTQDGLVRAKDPELAALGLFGLCRSSIFHRLLTGRELPRAERAGQVMDFFLHGQGGRR